MPAAGGADGPLAQDRNAELVKTTVDLLQRLKTRVKVAGNSLDNVSKSTRLSLTVLLGEVLTEIQEQGLSRVAAALRSSKACVSQLDGILATLVEIQDFLGEVENQQSLIIYLNKSRFKRKDQQLRTNLRAKATQFTSALTLLMIQQPGLGRARGGGMGAGSVGLGNVTIASSSDPASTTRSTSAITSSSSSATADTSSLGMIFNTGHCFYYGIGGRSRNYSTAFAKFFEAAELGDADSMAMLARCFLHGHGCEKDAANARLWLSKAAAAGSNAAKTDLALLLLSEVPETMTASQMPHKLSSGTDLGFTKADESSMRSFRSAIFTGGSTEQDDLAIDASERQKAVDWSMGEALRLLLEAASECHTEAQTQLALINEAGGSFADALKWFQLAAADGCPSGMVGLGRMHLKGLGGLEVNGANALSYFIAAGKAGCAEGWLYAGLACESAAAPNMAEALRFYHLAAEGGNVDGMYSYAHTLLRECIGMVSVGPSPGAAVLQLPPEERLLYESKVSEGIRYLRLASEAGVVDASFQLGRCYEQGLGVARDEQSALAQFKVAAAKGHALAAFCAANVLFTGFHSGLPSTQEVQQSIEFYFQAAELGNAAAVNCLGLLCEDGRVDCEAVASLLHPEAGSLNLTSSADFVLSDSASAAAVCRQNQRKQAAMLYYQAFVEHGLADAALNLALLLSGGDVSSFVSHQKLLVTAHEAFALLKAFEVPGPARAQFNKILLKIEQVVLVLVSEVARFEREDWDKRHPAPKAQGVPPSASSTKPAKTSKWNAVRGLLATPPTPSTQPSQTATTSSAVPNKPPKSPKTPTSTGKENLPTKPPKTPLVQ